jgi:putative ABC transport system ATP-binding protein
MKPTLLNLQQVGLTLAGVTAPILNNIDYDIHQNDFVILLGSNGSGKSSLLKIIDRRFDATQGCISLNDQEVRKYPPKEFHRRIITLTQNCMDSLFSTLTVFENCLLARACRETALLRMRAHSEHLFFESYLERFNVNLADKLEVIVSSLSGGEQQALALALNVLDPPQVLLLDEHTSALDPLSAEHVMQLTQQVINEHQITCILSTHDLEIALNYGDRILALDHGEILTRIEKKEKSMLTQQDLREACY